LANDIDTLPLTLTLSKGAKVIFDAHEYAPRELEDLLLWRILFQKYRTYLCKLFIPQISAMTTVCQGIADTYKEDTGIEPIVITNAPDFEEIQPKRSDQNETKIRMIHHGAAGPSRKIENMIKMMNYLDGRFELNLMLIESWPGYLRHLRRLARKNSNIVFLPPVPMRTLPRYLNQYDIGVFLLEPTNFNYFHALPNKFFEFIQARIAIAVGPSPEMARIVKAHDLGVVSDDFSPQSLARCLLDIDRRKLDYYKLQSHRVARTMSAEQNKKTLLTLVYQILGE
jgi:glycosyltransferase involved in cell wall biosynthesis